MFRTTPYKTWETIYDDQTVNENTKYQVVDSDENLLAVLTVLKDYAIDNLNELLSPLVEPTDFFKTWRLNIPGQTREAFDENWSKTFYVENMNDNHRDIIDIEYNWSYNTILNDEDLVLSNSPLPIIDYRMYFIYTVMPARRNFVQTYIEAENFATDIFGTNKEIYQRTFTQDEQQARKPFTWAKDFSNINWPGEFSTAYNLDYLVWNSIPRGTYSFVTESGRRFYVMNTCKDYALYYRNEFGGWNFLVVEGKSIEKENYTSSSYKQNTKDVWDVNTYSELALERQYVNYKKDFKTSFEFTTYYMTDEQSNAMRSLYRSNTVYLMDLNTRNIIPVTITDKTYTYKTFKNQGKKFAQHTFNVEIARDKTIWH